MITRQATKRRRNSGDSVLVLLDSDPEDEPSRKLRNSTCTNFIRDKKLASNLFQTLLEDLWSKIPVEKTWPCTYLDCLWFSLYKDDLMREKVLNWIKRKQIFTAKYTFIPIVCWGHWSLLILCHFGEPQQMRPRIPFMLLLDSLHETEPRRLEQDIRRFILDVYRSQEKEENSDSIAKIPLFLPEVPQQTNGEACGIYVLYFIHLFIHSIPSSYTQEGWPCFLNKDWFTVEELESFRKEIFAWNFDTAMVNPGEQPPSPVIFTPVLVER
ncbi:probable ubiquitin-like-specific protease 2A [Zingiber officinale]|uniref:Ubiquitin-like protease family profile domain-containing protein n=1 Tax=Zingiber officinale TaxID=94328 RepID=A0A8J5GX99_ZINOF|nr:probable ubiquitin-like-specific protease 2A [Zingiber officinale]XP_042379511.1 probable ubiquitin-like-specific protease 2A [Zingiber officinale]KAG6516623.1 hypothetical protein ZIOFF_027092 [Zingiber officinale]